MTLQINTAIIDSNLQKGDTKMTTYLSVGTNKILKELEQPIKNGNPKPTGGLWATIHDETYPNYNPWIEFLSTKPYILFYKNFKGNPFSIPAVLITLKDSAKIFHLNNINQLEFLKKHYPTSDDWIDFESLSHDYDGLYIDLFAACKDAPIEIKRQLAPFAISSLILFNLNSIKHYQEAIVDIEPYDFEFETEFSFYEIKIDDTLHEVSDIDDITKSFLSNLKSQLNTSIDERTFAITYDKALTEFAIEFCKKKECIESPETIKNLLVRNITRSI